MHRNRTATRLRAGYILVELIVAMVVLATLLGITVWSMHRRAMSQRPVLVELRGIFRFAAPGDCFRIQGDTLYERRENRTVYTARLNLQGIQVTGPVTADGIAFCFDDGRMGLVYPEASARAGSADRPVITEDICFTGSEPSAGQPVCLSPLGILFDPGYARFHTPSVR